ncbi:hypothetical protein [Microcoleus sp. AT3-A2]|uniref:hypothetical protein n=1 Tax=Microcoleus sp. AT3-A2 TaxID=2818610 RepID=UPI002FD6D1D6
MAQYPILDGENPFLLLVQHDYGLLRSRIGQLRAAAAGVEVQLGAITGFGRDASIAMKFGHIARVACLDFPTQNTHGSRLLASGAIDNCDRILKA